MISIKQEKSRTLSMAEVCSIEDFAIMAASDGGMLSTYVFERALLVFAAIVLYPDKKEEITSAIGDDYDIRVIFDKLLDEGIIEDMCANHKNDIDYITSVARSWFEDVRAYRASSFGLVDNINRISGDIVQNAIQQLQNATDGSAKDIQQFAENWGMNNTVKMN